MVVEVEEDHHPPGALARQEQPVPVEQEVRVLQEEQGQPGELVERRVEQEQKEALGRREEKGRQGQQEQPGRREQQGRQEQPGRRWGSIGICSSIFSPFSAYWDPWASSLCHLWISLRERHLQRLWFFPQFEP